MGRGNTQPSSSPGSCWKVVSQCAEAALVTPSTGVSLPPATAPQARGSGMGMDTVRDTQMGKIPVCPEDSSGHSPTKVLSSDATQGAVTPGVSSLPPRWLAVPRRQLSGTEAVSPVTSEEFCVACVLLRALQQQIRASVLQNK